MKKTSIIALSLFVLLSTITTQQNIKISKFDINKIDIENNILTKKKDLKKSLSILYGKNIFFLESKEIGNILMSNSFIESFEIKKKYPDTLKITIFEKKPIAILFNKKERFYLSDKIDLIEYNELKKFQDLPIVVGNKNKFKIFYDDLKTIQFPFNEIKKFTLYESNRWDLETIDKKEIKLPSENYLNKLENYLDLINRNNFKKYKVFDYRIENQFILK